MWTHNLSAAVPPLSMRSVVELKDLAHKETLKDAEVSNNCQVTACHTILNFSYVSNRFYNTVKSH